jgi:predicted RNase H-like HicB family nuclease
MDFGVVYTSFRRLAMANETTNLKSLEDRIVDLTARIERRTGAKIVPIQTFAPEPYSLLKPMSVLIEDSEDGYLASFFDANIGTSGETEQEAFENLKSLVLDIFDSLNREAPERLGPEPARQLAVLRSFIRAA